MVTIEEVAGDISRLEAEWHQLWRELQQPTPFQTFAWVTACNRTFGEESARVLVAHAPDRLVGILPLFGTDTVQLAGGGVSDYQDALVAPGFERMVMGAIVEYLREQPHRWSELHFENLRPESALLHGDFGENHTDTIESDDVCPTLLLSGPLAVRTGLPQAIPADQRENVGSYLRRAQKAGKLEFESVTFENLDEFRDAFFRFINPTKSPGLAAESLNALHQLAPPGLLRCEILRMYAMRLDRKIVGVSIGFLTPQRAFHYLTGFDSKAADLNPETILIAHAIEEAVREGASSFDFLRGNDPYKYAWGAHDTHTYCRKITRL